MRPLVTMAVLATLVGCLAGRALAHFGMVIPDRPIIAQEQKTTNIQLAFAHPWENIGMDLDKPKRFTVTANGQTTDLLPTLKTARFMDHQAWRTSYQFSRPGVYQFVMEPNPYWEPAEDLSIIHYTKVVVPAFGDDQGWDQPVGLPTEIVPLTRPFGNYGGNSFTGQVVRQGTPMAGAEVEVEFYNDNNKLRATSDYHVTQVVKADGNGIFTFACPLPGWWGFAALHEADYRIKDPQGHDKAVELGAVLWIYLDPLPQGGN